MFNEDLALFSLKLIKYGIFWHLFVTAFMYSNSKILSSVAQQGSDFYSAFLSGLYSSSSSSFKNILLQRFNYALHARLYLAALIIVGIIIILIPLCFRPFYVFV
jgi:hypothetical protein